MATPFDQAIRLQELRLAREAYASHHGEPASAAYCAAWLRFHERINTIDDLDQLRRDRARIRRQLDLGQQPVRPADGWRVARASEPSESAASLTV